MSHARYEDWLLLDLSPGAELPRSTRLSTTAGRCISPEL